jgi:hypothetical protein
LKTLGSKSKLKSLWAGHDVHPYLAYFNQRIKSLGFEFEVLNLESTRESQAYWYKRMFGDYNFVVSLSSENRDLLQDHSCIWSRCFLWVESKKLRRAFKFLRIESAKGVGTVGCIHLPWFWKHWDPKTPEAHELFNNISAEDSAARAETMFGFIADKGMRFYEMIHSPQKYVDLVLSPGTHLTVGRPEFRPFEPEINAIVTLLMQGWNEQCWAPMLRYEEKIQESSKRRVFEEAEMELEQSRIKVLKEWINAKPGEGIEKVIGG